MEKKISKEMILVGGLQLKQLQRVSLKKIPASVRFEPTCLEVKQVLEGLAGLRNLIRLLYERDKPSKIPLKK